MSQIQSNSLLIPIQDSPSFSKQINSNGATFFVRDRFTHSKSALNEQLEKSPVQQQNESKPQSKNSVILQTKIINDVIQRQQTFGNQAVLKKRNMIFAPQKQKTLIQTMNNSQLSNDNKFELNPQFQALFDKLIQKQQDLQNNLNSLKNEQNFYKKYKHSIKVENFLLVKKAKQKEEKMRLRLRSSQSSTHRSQRQSVVISGLLSPTLSGIVKPIRQFERVRSKTNHTTRNLLHTQNQYRVTQPLEIKSRNDRVLQNGDKVSFMTTTSALTAGGPTSTRRVNNDLKELYQQYINDDNSAKSSFYITQIDQNSKENAKNAIIEQAYLNHSSPIRSFSQGGYNSYNNKSNRTQYFDMKQNKSFNMIPQFRINAIPLGGLNSSGVASTSSRKQSTRSPLNCYTPYSYQQSRTNVVPSFDSYKVNLKTRNINLMSYRSRKMQDIPLMKLANKKNSLMITNQQRALSVPRGVLHYAKGLKLNLI